MLLIVWWWNIQKLNQFGKLLEKACRSALVFSLIFSETGTYSSYLCSKKHMTNKDDGTEGHGYFNTLLTLSKLFPPESELSV